MTISRSMGLLSTMMSIQCKGTKAFPIKSDTESKVNLKYLLEYEKHESPPTPTPWSHIRRGMYKRKGSWSWMRQKKWDKCIRVCWIHPPTIRGGMNESQHRLLSRRSTSGRMTRQNCPTRAQKPRESNQIKMDEEYGIKCQGKGAI